MSFLAIAVLSFSMNVEAKPRKKGPPKVPVAIECGAEAHRTYPSTATVRDSTGAPVFTECGTGNLTREHRIAACVDEEKGEQFVKERAMGSDLENWGTVSFDFAPHPRRPESGVLLAKGELLFDGGYRLEVQAMTHPDWSEVSVVLQLKRYTTKEPRIQAELRRRLKDEKDFGFEISNIDYLNETSGGRRRAADGSIEITGGHCYLLFE
jgi:hypothetical protein